MKIKITFSWLSLVHRKNVVRKIEKARKENFRLGLLGPQLSFGVVAERKSKICDVVATNP